jgi:hypothetical protein
MPYSTLFPRKGLWIWPQSYVKKCVGMSIEETVHDNIPANKRLERWNAQNIEILQDRGGGGATPKYEYFVVQRHCLLWFFYGSPHMCRASVPKWYIVNIVLYLHASPAGQIKQSAPCNERRVRRSFSFSFEMGKMWVKTVSLRTENKFQCVSLIFIFVSEKLKFIF